MRVRVFRSNRNGQWYFNLLGDNGEIVASSEGHKRRIDAVDVAQQFVTDDTPLEIDDA